MFPHSAWFDFYGVSTKCSREPEKLKCAWKVWVALETKVDKVLSGSFGRLPSGRLTGSVGRTLEEFLGS